MKFKNDAEIFEYFKAELHTAVVGDVMDVMGLRRQFLPPTVKPLRDDMIIAGRAMTVLEADCYQDTVSYKDERKPFGVMFEALDDLKENEVYICNGASHNYALWGELMSNCAINQKAAGAVVYGYTRDTKGILDLDFPTFSIGTYAQDQGVRGRVIDYRCKIEFDNGVSVCDGDVVFGDRDGVLIIPSDRLEEVVELATIKVNEENKVRDAILGGMKSKKAYDTFGIM